MANPFCHIELNSNDPGKAKEFYKNLLDWEYQEWPMEDGEYTVIKTGKDPGGGIFKNPVPDKAPSHWLIYIEVSDIDSVTSKAAELGATIHKEVMDIPDMGKFSVLEDPTGAVFAFWQPAKKE
ncbi:MAG: VOC family protein [bacterium]|nr:VOC family protein [bacterium]